jgi:hypothetical protein
MFDGIFAMSDMEKAVDRLLIELDRDVTSQVLCSPLGW